MEEREKDRCGGNVYASTAEQALATGLPGSGARQSEQLPGEGNG